MRTQRLLVIDDDPSILRLVRSILTRAKYYVVTCPSAREALRRLNADTFDCIITDAVMPVMNGYDLTGLVREHPKHQAVPILMLTRKRDRQDVKKAVAVGVTDYVLKPIDEHLLLDKVEMCLKSGLGKRHIFECPITEPQGKAELGLDCKVVFMSESDMTLRIPFDIPIEAPFKLRTDIFDNIGIPPPQRKLIRCDEAPATNGPAAGTLPFEAKFALVGVPEPDLKKIRAWLQRQEIQQKK
jgi:DNA-binding response OmpR family regulator